MNDIDILRQFILVLISNTFLNLSTNAEPITWKEECSLNGDYNFITLKCECFQGWKGDSCETLSLVPVDPLLYNESGGTPGVAIPDNPTWGGGAAFEGGKWHLIVGARAVDMHNNTQSDYPCDSKIIHVVSDGPDPLGPYSIVETVFSRSSWEPGIAKNPFNGELVLMFFGNMTNPPPVGSPACMIPSLEYNLTTINTYILSLIHI